MAEGDEDKMAFFAGEGIFCYRKMPFGLKNTGATYQRLVDKVFYDQIRRNLEAYVDDMLNPKKCSFDVEEGPFLGHLITKQGIRANPSKINAITDVEQPKTLKDIQSLNGKIAALIRFLSKGVERSLPFFKVLKSCTDKKNIQWTQEAKAALQEMKKLVEILPTLTEPIQGESIFSLCYLFCNPFSSTTMGDENPIRTLGDYSKPSHEGYRNTIELPVGNNMVPLRSDTIRLVQNGCSFHGLRSEDPNQHLKDFLKLVDSLDLDGENRERTRLHLFQFSLRDQASNWLERLPAGSITTWEDLTTRFLA
ncbi:hypothetical protein Tco_0006878 [Tanacetum coccineum]